MAETHREYFPKQLVLETDRVICNVEMILRCVIPVVLCQ
jgi:hypothetical protein